MPNITERESRTEREAYRERVVVIGRVFVSLLRFHCLNSTGYGFLLLLLIANELLRKIVI